MAEFSTGVTTLLARMDTNPSEFFDGAYKWSFLNADWVKTILTEAEEAALTNKIIEIRRVAFDQMVMQTLLDGEAEEESRIGLARLTKGKTNTITSNPQMALQGSSLMSSMTKSELQQQMQNQYANAYANAVQNTYPSGTITGRFTSGT